MTKFLQVALLLLMFASARAEEVFFEECEERGAFFPNSLLIEGKVGFFIPLSKNFRDVYSEVECIWGAEATYQLTDLFQAWVSLSYLSDKGRSLGESRSTRVSLLPIGFGIKAIYQAECVSYYLGGGLQYSRLHTKDDSPFVIQKVTHWDWGVLAKGGALIPLCDRFFLDLFVEYSYLTMSFRKTGNGRVSRNRANLSSVNFGLGLGFQL